MSEIQRIQDMKWFVIIIIGIYLLLTISAAVYVSGLKLVGFKPRKCLKRYFHVKPAQFIYPDESVSTVLLSRNKPIRTRVKYFRCIVILR